jgi:hypothetical protein
LNRSDTATPFTLHVMPTNSENDQQAEAPDQQPSAPIVKMLNALDDLLAATQRVAVERRTTGDRIPEDPEAAGGAPLDSR